MPQTTKDLYEILGVDRNATEAEIKKAFRHRARELHPDVNDSPNAEDEFKELNEAYDVLSDPNKRAQYDRFGTIPGAGGMPGSGYVDFEDIFGGFGGMGDLFSTFFGGGGRDSRQQPKEGRDMGIGIDVTLEQVATGIKREIVYDRLATCADCDGTGMSEGGKEVTCSECQGRGVVTSVQRTIFGNMQSQTTCPKCNGTGTMIEGECEECQGQGRVPDRQRVSVEIPAGIRDGQQLRVSGFGEAGIRNAASGDLLVTVRVTPHKHFEREGTNLYAAVTIPMVQAALGGSIEINGIMEDEVIKLKVPSGTQNGDVLKSKGHGLPKIGSHSRGDLFVHVSIDIPKKLSKKEKRILNEFADETDVQLDRAPIGLKDLRNR